MDKQDLEKIASVAKRNVIRQVYEAKSGHIGGSLSLAEILTVLYFEIMDINPQDPCKENRDKLVMSKGHATPILYAILSARGYFNKEELKHFRQIDSPLQGHPSMTMLPGVDMSTGSLGQGMSASVGMALANKIKGIDSRIYTILGDGELQEGIIWEAAMAAGHYHLDCLCATVDNNGLQIDGKNDDVMTVEPIDAKFKDFGWNVIYANGHDVDSLKKAYEEAKAYKGKPSVVIAKTHKGNGVSFMSDNPYWHGKAPSEDEAIAALKELGGDLAWE